MTDDGEDRSILPLLRSVIEMQQNVNKTLRSVGDRQNVNKTLRSVGDRYDRVQSDIDRLPRLLGRLEENLTISVGRVEEGQSVLAAAITDAVKHLDAMAKRLDAIVIRLEELERVVDRGMVEAREMRSDLVGQSNEILNALQIGLFARAELDDALGRIGQIERKLGG